MQKFVLLIEPSEEKPLKIGNLFINRFAVDEDAASEVLKIFEVEKTSYEMSHPRRPKYKNFTVERIQKGKDLINFTS